MKILGNIIWVVFGGLEMAVAYFCIGLLLMITIIGIPASTPSSAGVPFTTDNENILRLVKAIGHRQLSVKEMLAAVGLKDRMNFMEYSLTPAMTEGFVCLLYPDKPKHPRQKYLLTVKGFALYNELTKDASK